MSGRAQKAKPSIRLWGAVRVWAWLFMASAALAVVASGYRVWLLAQIPGDTPMGEYDLLSDYVVGAEAELWTSAVAGLLNFATYVVAAFLVLKWYLRSLRNAHALYAGVETSPKWAIWGFIVPVLSLWKPYSMTSELWRSSQSAERWKGMPDPSLLRWWWGAVLAGGFCGTAANIMARGARTASQMLASDAALIASFLISIVAGLLFLRIGRAISCGQTELITSGGAAPATRLPGWAP